MSVRSWLLLTGTVVNFFSLEYSRPFYSMFFFISYLQLISDLFGTKNNKDVEKEKVVDIEEINEELKKKENAVIKGW